MTDSPPQFSAAPTARSEGSDEYLKRLYADANAVIADLNKFAIRGPVNWADLGCVEARHVTAHCGDYDVESYEIIVEEAGPEATELQTAIALGLVEKGHVGINVVTEW
jgi:hypothetical protein